MAKRPEGPTPSPRPDDWKTVLPEGPRRRSIGDLIPAPRWLDAWAIKAVAVGVTVALIAGGGLVIRSALTEDPAPASPELPPVAGYEGPVTWHGQRDVYARFERFASCLPDEIPDVDQTFRGGLTPEGRLRVITKGVEGLRGLSFTHPPDVKLMTRSAFDRTLRRFIEREADRAALALDFRILVELGVLPAGTDLSGLAKSDTSAIAGVYVPKEEKVYVPKGAGTLSKLEELILAHEVEHALADQIFGLPTEESRPRNEDATQAATALIEGDASLTAEQYDLVLGLESPEAFLTSSGVASAAQPNVLPYFLQRSFTFPYIEGLLFVCELYALGGWEAVNQAYADPPTTTAEVLFPSRYVLRIGSDDPSDPPDLPSPWDKRPTHSFGAADLLWLLQVAEGQTTGPRAGSADLVRRWNGGEIHIWTRGDETALALGLVDGGEKAGKHRPSPTLCARMRNWVEATFSGAAQVGSEGRVQTWRTSDGYMALSCRKEGPRFVTAPDSRTTRMLAAEAS